MRRLTDEQEAAIQLAMKTPGLSQREIMLATGVSKHAVRVRLKSAGYRSVKYFTPANGNHGRPKNAEGMQIFIPAPAYTCRVCGHAVAFLPCPACAAEEYRKSKKDKKPLEVDLSSGMNAGVACSEIQVTQKKVRIMSEELKVAQDKATVAANEHIDDLKAKVEARDWAGFFNALASALAKILPVILPLFVMDKKAETETK